MLQLGWYLSAGQVEPGPRRTAASSCDRRNVGSGRPIRISLLSVALSRDKGEKDRWIIAELTGIEAAEKCVTSGSRQTTQPTGRTQDPVPGCWIAMDVQRRMYARRFQLGAV